MWQSSEGGWVQLGIVYVYATYVAEIAYSYQTPVVCKKIFFTSCQKEEAGRDDRQKTNEEIMYREVMM